MDQCTENNKTLEARVMEKIIEKGLTIATAESCTGGLLSGRLINFAGASDCFLEGFVTYSNEAKMKSLSVSPRIIEDFGAVSAECAEAMAKGAALNAGTYLALSTTGIAGPSGGSPDKPVGLVYIGCYVQGQVFSEKHIFEGGRQSVRTQAVEQALQILDSRL